MQVVRIVIISALCQCLFISSVESKMQRQSIEIETLGRYLFIGQVYPSGNAYLKPFTGNSEANSLWPEGLSLIALSGARPDLPRIRRGIFDRRLASRTDNDVVKSLYIPGVEGMDESHDSCGLGVINPENALHELLSGDFFRTNIDHCEPNDGVGVYRTVRSNFSVMTIGIADNLSIVSYKIIPDKFPRPLTAFEKQEVDREKAEAAKDNGKLECTTTPSYLDAASEIFEASMGEGNFTLRVSAYDNPGCAGHLTSTYILDVLRSGELLKKFVLSQYQGAL
jgi:hypothetical protein